MEDQPRVVGEHVCDDEYQVVTVEGGPNRDRKRICGDCPWRMDAEVGTFPPEAFRHSARTAYDMADTRFACHDSGREKPQTCVGFLLRGANHNLSVRMSPVDLDTLDADGVDLYPNYRAMAIANGVDPDDPVLAPCRDT